LTIAFNPQVQNKPSATFGCGDIHRVNSIPSDSWGVQQEILIALGQRVRELRKRKGFSQEAFADETGVHRTWMGAIERGERNLSFHNLVLISRALGITLSQLVSGLEKRARVIAHHSD